MLIVDEEHEGDDDAGEVLFPLVADGLEDYRFLLTEGKFVDAVGFDLEDHDTVAVPHEIDATEDGRFIYSLTWTTRP